MRDFEIINILKRSEKKILIYGNANHAELIYNNLKENEIIIEAFFVDDYFWKPNMYIQEIEVKKLSDFAESLSEYNIIIGFCDVEKTKFILSNANLLKGKYYLFWEPLTVYVWNKKYLQENRKLFELVYDNLADEKSKRVLEELVKAKLSGDIGDLIKLADNQQYFNELTWLANCEDEVFVDCGAFIGDTIAKYTLFSGNKYKKIFAFEPNVENAKLLKENTHDLQNITIVTKGTWSYSTNLNFDENGSASQVVENGKGITTIPVTSIDSIVRDEKVTFIKMDVEGSELESLKGATNTIRHNMPKLAICCYHRADDIINIYQFISEFENETVKYAFYLRHHSNSAYETVLYAIPLKK